MIRNEIYGVHAVHDSEPTIDNLYPEVYVRMLLWVYGTKKNVPSLISEHIVATEGYCHVRQAALAEANRLLYVGMTRPRDVMLLEIKPAKRGKKPLLWFEAVGYTSITPQPEQGAWDIFGTGNKFADFTVTPEERDRMAEGGMLKDGPSYRLIRTSSTGLPEEETESSVFSPRYLSPSQISYKGNVASATDFGARIAFISRPSDMAEVGDCIHQIFSYIEESKRNVVKTIQQYGLDNVLSGADEIVESWNRLTTFLTHAHGAALRTYHERPFRLERDGQTIVGSIDLVWKTLDGCILVDYKTCPMGAKAVLDAGSEHYAGWYAGQLDAYTEALELAGEKVLKRYIYYPVAGIVAEVERTFKTEIK